MQCTLIVNTATTIRNSARICHHGTMSVNAAASCVGAGGGVAEGGRVMAPPAGAVCAGVLATGITGVAVGDVLLFG